jgi:NADPH2:quinone reductase
MDARAACSPEVGDVRFAVLGQGAAVMLQGLTAHSLATSTYALKEGDRCLVHAAAGGVGLLLVQIARRRAART